MKVGCHVLYEGNNVFRMHVIELDADGYCIGHSPLCHEQPSVVWNPGVCVLLPEMTVPADGMSVKDVMAAAGTCDSSVLMLWNAEKLPADAPYDTPVARWIRCR